jgi:hypothetical protein
MPFDASCSAKRCAAAARAVFSASTPCCPAGSTSRSASFSADLSRPMASERRAVARVVVVQQAVQLVRLVHREELRLLLAEEPEFLEPRLHRRRDVLGADLVGDLAELVGDLRRRHRRVLRAARAEGVVERRPPLPSPCRTP